jgi:ABC-type polar amino acid transport system ATPase subunit
VTETVLRLENVHKSFGDTEVLRGIDLDVHAHDVVALIGASGSGKSTLLRTVNLLERVDDGQIWLHGDDISAPQVKADAVRLRIGIVFQQFNLFPHLSVLDNVTISTRHVQRTRRSVAEARGLELPDRLSGGQQQRVAIARAIATDPELLLLDEITSALDPQLVGEVLDLVRQLKSDGTTIVMATHEMAFARDVADHVVFLDEGVIGEQGPPAQIFTAPQTVRAREFLGRFLG